MKSVLNIKKLNRFLVPWISTENITYLNISV